MDLFISYVSQSACFFRMEHALVSCRFLYRRGYKYGSIEVCGFPLVQHSGLNEIVPERERERERSADEVLSLMVLASSRALLEGCFADGSAWQFFRQAPPLTYYLLPRYDQSQRAILGLLSLLKFLPIFSISIDPKETG